ncbi:MAG: hypothetical protein M0P77_01705 [Firmicutes bacterium]|nr:hypothetical protein [Bacillota bacterium]
MIKNFNSYSNYPKNSNDKFWKVYRYSECISDKENSALQELLDFTMKNKTNCKKKKEI